MDHITKNPLDGLFVDELGTSTGPWPRYLVMTATDEGKTLSKLSPFAIHKGVKGVAGGEVTIKLSLVSVAISGVFHCALCTSISSCISSV